jgi:hypothetical protein
MHPSEWSDNRPVEALGRADAASEHEEKQETNIVDHLQNKAAPRCRLIRLGH